MPYVILKHTEIQGTPRTIIVNDSEGIPMEFVKLILPQETFTK